MTITETMPLPGQCRVKVLEGGGKVLKRGGGCGVIESVKTASEICAPVSGEVAEVNSELTENPDTVNRDPLGNGWILKLKNFSAQEFEALMDDAEYEAWSNRKNSNMFG